MISVVICTYNRADLLPDLLASLAHQNAPDVPIEILFVDNNSRDNTSALLQSQIGTLPFPARVLPESRQGLSHARNRGWQEAQHPYVIFLDDDARPDADWLAAYARELAKWQPEAGGGPVIPLSMQPLPAWLKLLSPDFAEYVGHLEMGHETRWLNADEGVFGGNMVLRRDVLASVDGFDPRLGANGKKRLGGEETRVQARVREQGGRILYVPAAGVQHLITRRHCSLRYYARHNYERGMSLARIEGAKPWKWTIAQAARHGVRSAGALLRGWRPQAAVNLGRSAGYLGQLQASRHLRREGQ